MEDVRKAAQERAARTRNVPVGKSFETERQRSKNALVKQLTSQDGRNVHMIAAATQAPEENKLLRVAAYCRVSTDDIDQAISIHLQIQHYMKKIRENPNWKYVGCYVDDGFSGTNTDHRQGFQKLMKDAMDGKIDMIITKAVSRFARNLMDCIGWVEALQNHDPPVRVFFEQENLDTMSQTSGIILFVLAMVAQEESHMKSEAVLLSLEWRFSRGRFLTPRLFGYDSVDVPDGFGGKKKVLLVNEEEARVVRWMYSSLLNGATSDEIAKCLTDLAIPTGGRRRDGTLNTHWDKKSIVKILRNEKYCGDVLARKTYTPNYKDHKKRKNNGKKNKYFQPDHHEAVISRSMWNAAQRILNSHKYGYDGSYLPMQIIDHGALTGFISMNRTWAGFDFADYYRACQIAMGILDESLDADLGSEYLPENGRRMGGLIDDHGITQIARDLTAAEQEIKDELEGRSSTASEENNSEENAKTFQVVNGNMFSRVYEPSLRISTKYIRFTQSCIDKLQGTETVEFLFNPVKRIVVVRPCSSDHPNAIKWDGKQKFCSSIVNVIYESMGWEYDYYFLIPCCSVKGEYPSDLGDTVLVFYLDSFVGKTNAKKDEAIIAKKETPDGASSSEEAKSYYYPPDEDEPQEIKEIEERFQAAVAVNKKMFGTPVHLHGSAAKDLTGGQSESGWDMMAKARPLDSTHTVDEKKVDALLHEIRENPPALPRHVESYPAGPIDVQATPMEE